MSCEQLQYHARPRLKGTTMVLAFTGWMDGGDVSTGTIESLVDILGAQKLADIAAEDFYIYNFPGPMEISSLFRPHVRIRDGLVETFEPPSNRFSFDPVNHLVLFSGKEPNFRWSEFADCIFAVASEVGVSMIYFIGSVGGLVPHTREPRLYSTVSDPKLKESLADYSIRFTNYEGPSSIITYLFIRAAQKDIHMASLVAEIPAYIQGRNPKSIESVLRKLAAILRLKIDLKHLRAPSEEWEKRVNDTVEEGGELGEHIRKLEEDYDNDVFDTQMGDLKSWLEQQGIRLD